MKVRRRPTRRAFLVGGAGVLLIAMASTAQAAWLFVLGAFVVGLVLASVLAPRRAHATHVQVRHAPTTTVGEHLDVVVEAQNRRRRPMPAQRLRYECAGLAPCEVLIEGVPSGGRVSVRVPVLATTRGRWSAGDIVSTNGAPFGFLSVRRTATVSEPLEVWPVLYPAAPPRPRAPRGATSRQPVAVAAAGTGEDLHAVREYRHGDPIRLVHWRTSARAGRLVVREMERPVEGALLAVLGGSAGPAYEESVVAVASLAAAAIRDGRHVVLARADGAGTDTTRVRSVREVLSWCAGADPVDLLPTAAMPVLLTRQRDIAAALVAVPTGSRAAAELPSLRAALGRVGIEPRVLVGGESDLRLELGRAW